MANNKTNGYFVYKYEYDGSIVYIGKTINLYNRINQHKTEPKFKDFVKQHSMKYEDFVIKYYSLDHEFEMDAVEKLLINSIKPLLNSTNKTNLDSKVSIKLEYAENIYDFKTCNVLETRIINSEQDNEPKHTNSVEEIKRYRELKELLNWIDNINEFDHRLVVNDYPRDNNRRPILPSCTIRDESMFYCFSPSVCLLTINDLTLLRFEALYLKMFKPIIIYEMTDIYNRMCKVANKEEEKKEKIKNKKYNYSYSFDFERIFKVFDISKHRDVSVDEIYDIEANYYSLIDKDKKYLTLLYGFLDTLDVNKSSAEIHRDIKLYIDSVWHDVIIEMHNVNVLSSIIFQLYHKNLVSLNFMKYLIYYYKLDEKTRSNILNYEMSNGAE